MQTAVANALLDIKAVGFNLQQPILFKSGILSPVYVDNRILPSHPQEWQLIIASFQQLVKDQHLDYEIIAGIETAGIPHSAALAFATDTPSVFVRKQSKDHGTKKMVEGGEVAGKKVLLIEDHISTGGSSLSGVQHLRAAGAQITDCLAISTYGFPESKNAFDQAGVALHTLTDFSHILEQAKKRNILQAKEVAIVQTWLENPRAWSDKHHGK